MNALLRFIRDPLAHFLLGGGLLFAVFALLHGGSPAGGDEARTIVVDRAALLKYMQYQSAAFEPAYFEAQYAAMSPADRKALIDKYVQEEALVREARAMGLDRVDYVIRQRLVQKMTYLIDDAATATARIDEAALRRHFETHRDDYRGQAALTFTHVFIDNEVRHRDGGERTARALLATLEARRAAFADAPAYGDRIPFLQNFVDRAPDFVANQFGQGFADAVAKLEPSDHWQGPVRSDYGWHLILLTAKTPAKDPRFEEVHGQVKEEMLVDANAAYRAKAIADLVRHYDVTIEGLAAR
jgi:peptidyl-prolyl cis-trans isomerase C